MRALLLLLAVACTRPSAERALGDLDIGSAVLGGTNVTVTDGMAAIRRLADNQLELWASAPAIEVTLVSDATQAWTIVVNNTPVDAVLAIEGRMFEREPGTRPTVARFDVPLVSGANRMVVAPADHQVPGAFRIAAMADIQSAMPSVHEVFEAISAVPDLRFVVAMGDITDRAEVEEYELFEQKLLALDIPFYSTIGNHELWADPDRWFTRFGRMNFQFTFKGAAFTFVDSGDAGLDPVVEEWLDSWLADAGTKPHVFLTHMPPIDPVAYRYGGFRSMRDGHRLLARLVEGGVDLTLYGHIHTHIEFENAGIPARISGGGGADPMKLDGIDRHFLVLDVDDRAIQNVSVQRVD
ncbi:MAG: metallophosphoesterase [Myxococcota bacterium]|nr:metallophosphoesterase [Myxococcota bacterium]